MRVLMLLALLGATLPAHSQTHTDPTRKAYKVSYIGPFASLGIIGSQDLRTGLYLGLQTVRPEKRLNLAGKPFNLVLEGNVGYSYGGGWNLRPRDEVFTVGALALMRYERMGPSRRGFFYELGFGVYYATEETFDVNLRWNTSPVSGIGWFIPYGDRDYQIGLRLYHISNGGARKPNQGQNQLVFMFGMRF